jgi:hypothetical protein
MRKILKEWGKGLGIYFSKEEIEIYGLVGGEILELDDMLIQKVKKKKEEKNGRK